MKNLLAKNGSEIVFETQNAGVCNPAERFDVFIEEFARFEKNVTVNRTKEAAVYLNVEGEDGLGGRRNRCPRGLDGKGSSAVCIDGDGHEFNVCWAHAVQGTVSVGGYVDIEGQIFSKHLSQRGKLNVTLTLPDPACCIPPPPEPEDCACYIDYAPTVASASAGTEITMRGHNFINDPSIPKRTVDFVLFYKDTTEIPGDDLLSKDEVNCRVANPTIVNDTTLRFNVPSTCPAGIYRLVLFNRIDPGDKGPWCSNSAIVLQVN
jgi:hypothetical protein